MEKNKRQLQAEQTRDKIIKTTIDLMKSKRLCDIRIREITKLAGISIGTFYLYFSCKEAVILYSYRQADKIFEELPLQGSAEENLTTLLDTYLHLVEMDKLSEVTEIYSAHLTYHDAYFFDENRPVFQKMKEELLRFDLSEETAKSITWKLLCHARGLIYNLCIAGDLYDKSTWHQEQLAELQQYLQFQLQQV